MLDPGTLDAIARRAAELAEVAPALSPDQKDRLRVLLRPSPAPALRRARAAKS